MREAVGPSLLTLAVVPRTLRPLADELGGDVVVLLGGLLADALAGDAAEPQVFSASGMSTTASTRRMLFGTARRPRFGFALSAGGASTESGSSGACALSFSLPRCS